MMRSIQLLLLASLLLVTSASKLKGAHKNKAVSRQLKKKIAGPRHRECDVSEKDNKVKFECKTKSGHSKDGTQNEDEAQDRGISIEPDASIKDKIKYEVKTTDGGISVKLEYKNEIEMDDTETETKTKFELLFVELVEYVKGSSNTAAAASSNETADNTDQAYDWEDDEIVQRLSLDDWADIPGVVDDGVSAHFTATSSAMQGGGSIAFTFKISRADQGEHITANNMKIDVRILDFPWSREDSYVALMSSLESEKKVKVEYEREATVGKGHKAKDVTISFGGEEMEDAFGFSTYGEYTWAQEADATGGEVATADDNSNMGFNGTVMQGRQSGGGSGVVVDGAMEVLANPEPEAMVESTTSTIEVIATSPDETYYENVEEVEGSHSHSRDDPDNKPTLIAYSFVGEGAQGASNIYWDPEAGIGYQSGVGKLNFFMGLLGSTLVALFSFMA